jgi:hypothetical protein
MDGGRVVLEEAREVGYTALRLAVYTTCAAHRVWCTH